jgi:hypothetical protein
MAEEGLLESRHWRLFRLFLCDLSDEEWEIEGQLEREHSTMCTSDLETAAEQLPAEPLGRAEDQRLAGPSETGPPRHHSNGKSPAPRHQIIPCRVDDRDDVP